MASTASCQGTPTKHTFIPLLVNPGSTQHRNEILRLALNVMEVQDLQGAASFREENILTSKQIIAPASIWPWFLC